MLIVDLEGTTSPAETEVSPDTMFRIYGRFDEKPTDDEYDFNITLPMSVAEQCALYPEGCLVTENNDTNEEVLTTQQPPTTSPDYVTTEPVVMTTMPTTLLQEHETTIAAILSTGKIYVCKY